MSMENNLMVEPAERELVIDRVLDAPRELVFKAWTDPKHVVQWWGPKGFTTTVHEMNVRPGGVWRFIMHGPDGVDYDNKIVYNEIVKPERLVYAHGSEEDDSGQFQVTVTFVEEAGKTRLTMRMLFPSVEERDNVKATGAIEGGNSTLDCLEEHLVKMTEMEQDVTEGANERELILTRDFNAPRELVFEAFSKPEHLTQWWGPKGWTLPVCEMDFRPGGTWLYCMRGPQGEDAWGKAIYQEIVAPERIVYIDQFVDAEGTPIEGMPELVVTVEFIEEEGKTKIISSAQFATVAELKSVVEMGMVEGLNQTWDRLEEHLARIGTGQ